MTTHNSTTLTRRLLHDGWTVTAARGPVPASVAGREYPASVPGCVHTDLMAAGAIDDPYLDANEAATAWIGLTDWTFRTTLHWQPDAHQRHELVFVGLDTIGTVLLNGDRVASVDNMHRTWRIDLTGRLRPGRNELAVEFRSPVRAANAASLAQGTRPRPYPTPFNAIRKMACSFGWDWGIATATSGIWREVALESWSGARLGALQTIAQATERGGALRVRAEVVRADTRPAALRVRVAGEEATVPVQAASAEVVLDLPDVHWWWPRGHGEQPLYPVEVALLDAGGAELDATSRRVGFRTVHWDTEPDEAGTPFALVVNGRPVYVRGVNWIPDDAFPTRVDRARYARRLTQAAEANLNLIRVWGGGFYEADDFYDLCDELGLLTWQDFLFACAAYADEEPMRSSVEAEVRDNLDRIAHHPSLVLLNGNNENLWGYEDWGWQLALDGKSWGAGYYYDLLPSLVGQLAPQVPYTPGSPFSPDGQHPNAEQHGSMHIWDLWNQRDWPHYRDYAPRFVAEFGWQGPPTWTTLTDAVHDDPLTPESPWMLVHQKALEGNAKLTAGLVRHLRVPEVMEDWHWAMQLNQATAIRTALTHFRSLSPHNRGAIVWQFNDCWPVTSWAAVDGNGRPKPLFHALKRAFAPRLLTLEPAADGLELVAVNDTDLPWAGAVRLRRLAYRGDVLAEVTLELEVPARGRVTELVPAAVSAPTDPASEVVVAELDDSRSTWFFGEPRDTALAQPSWTVDVTSDGEESLVRATPDVLVREAYLLIDKVEPDAAVDDGLVTLLPGETATFRVQGAPDLTARAVADPRVLRCLNQLVTR